MCRINKCSLYTVWISLYHFSFTQIGELSNKNWTINITHKHSNIVVMSLKNNQLQVCFFLQKSLDCLLLKNG